MKKILSAFLLLIAGSLFAHEFWLHPDKFIYETGDLINIKFMVGENYEGHNWSGNSKSIESLQLHLEGNVSDDMQEHIGDSTGDSLQLAIYDEGTYMVTYNSKNKFIQLDPQKFLEYLKEDGLQNAIDYRAAHNETDSIGRENYQRSVKTIFQVGAQKTNLYKKETSLPIDIIPLQNPYEIKPGTRQMNFAVKVLFRKNPLVNQQVFVWHRINNDTDKLTLTTDERGIISFPVNRDGRWMVSTVKMERVDGDTTVQWQSYWGSCTWGFGSEVEK